MLILNCYVFEKYHFKTKQFKTKRQFIATHSSKISLDLPILSTIATLLSDKIDFLRFDVHLTRHSTYYKRGIRNTIGVGSSRCSCLNASLTAIGITLIRIRIGFYNQFIAIRIFDNITNIWKNIETSIIIELSIISTVNILLSSINLFTFR